MLRCHVAAFEALGGAPREILYDRMKTAVIGEDADGAASSTTAALLDLARHYGFHAQGLPAVSRQDEGQGRAAVPLHPRGLLPGRTFRNLDDLNAQFRHWLDTVANPRVHATTRRVVNEDFAEEQPALQPLPPAPYQAVLRLERRISRDGMVCVGGNLYSVPDTARRRRASRCTCMADEVRIFEDGALIAVHPVWKAAASAAS